MNIIDSNIETKIHIKNSTPIEDKLHVIVVMSNICEYKIRYKLCEEFIDKMEREQDIIIYVVELAYNNQTFKVTNANNKRHLQLRTEIPLWHKENMINLGIKYLLPSDWKAVAWIDADIEFDNPHWATDTLKILNRNKDVVQLFSHAVNMSKDMQIQNIYTGFAYQYCHNFKKDRGIHYWHPGFAWACSRNAYDKLGKIFEHAILGSGDNIISSCFLGKGVESLKKGMSNNYINFVREYQNKFAGLKLGYVSGSIRHHYHGKKKNRKYYGREDILINNKYDPNLHVSYDASGILIPTSECSKQFLNEIFEYFTNRNEDDITKDNEADTDGNESA